MHIVLISDFHYNEIKGGAEANDAVLESLLKDKGHKVDFVLTKDFNEKFKDYDKADLFIVSNFYFISPQAERYLESKTYIIIEHDYKFCRTRNPYLYPNYEVPAYEKVHYPFYISAHKIVVQSQLQYAIFKRNLDITNLSCFSGNLWPEEELTLMQKLAHQSKNRKAAVLKSDNPIKGTQQAINHCNAMGKPFDLISEPDHEKFLRQLAKYETFVFLPQSPETFSRTCLEAKMMGLNVITNDLVGVVRERIFGMFADDIVTELRNKKKELVALIEQYGPKRR